MNDISASAPWVRLYRFVFGAVVLVAVGYQLSLSTNVGNFFSFFTIQSNLIASVVLLIGAILVPAETRLWSLVRGGAAIYMILTGVIFNTLLTDIVNTLQTTEPWVDYVLHVLMPIVMFLDLFILPLGKRVTWRQATVWAVYPTFYLAYSLIRGPIVDWYPYPFLDPRTDGGYIRVLLFSVFTLVAFFGATWLITEFSGWRLRRQRPPQHS